MFFFMVIDDKAPSHNKIHQAEINEQLFVKIGENDSDALAELYRITHRAVYALVLSILKNPDLTQDVVQDTYIKIRSAAHLYQPQGKPLAWIFTIAKNMAFSAMRQNGSGISDEELPENDLRYSCVSDPTDRLVLSAALTILQEEERQVVILHAVSGVTFIEMAKAFDMPISTVLSRYHRALKKLKNYLIQKGAYQ
ncbi:MAG: RNA polymerase sigma factor [Oscillospiraceae bacterium]